MPLKDIVLDINKEEIQDFCSVFELWKESLGFDTKCVDFWPNGPETVKPSISGRERYFTSKEVCLKNGRTT